MITPREQLYINTFLEKRGRGIWFEFCNGYNVYIKNSGNYVLKFDSIAQSIDFEERISMEGHDGLSLDNQTIKISKNDRAHIVVIDCGRSLNLAKKLTKHLRRQWVHIRRNEINERKKLDEQEIKDIGLKF